jgi:hypothetical protein
MVSLFFIYRKLDSAIVNHIQISFSGNVQGSNRKCKGKAYICKLNCVIFHLTCYWRKNGFITRNPQA